MKPNGHTVLVTGGATGIGFALAKRFQSEGNQVILVGRQESALTQASAALGGVKAMVADVSVASDRERLAAVFPDVNILVNNAAVRYETPFSDASAEELIHELNVNLLAPVLLAKAFLPGLKTKSEAAIVNVTSGLALVPREVAAMYSASKAGLHSFSKSMRWQLEGTCVKVFEVLPPMVATNMTAHRTAGNGKISADQLAQEFWQAFTNNRYEVLVGKTKLLQKIYRLSPRLADRVMRREPS